ncbi:MAG: hypothetical protein K2N51_20830 [Lachnospiraceae bacterium]|nr:hypothetical protein [Lachnospiraceae bacterium]
MSIEELRKEAWTFRGLTPPNNAKKVAEEQRNGEVYEYFKDDSGNVYYETSTGKKWKLEILSWARKKGTDILTVCQCEVCCANKNYYVYSIAQQA